MKKYKLKLDLFNDFKFITTRRMIKQKCSLHESTAGEIIEYKYIKCISILNILIITIFLKGEVFKL